MKQNIPVLGGPLDGKRRSRMGFDDGGNNGYRFTPCSAGDFWLHKDHLDKIFADYIISRFPSKAAKAIPTTDDILSIPLARVAEYELSDKEVEKTRRRIYSLNKDNAAGWRWRTLRDGTLLLVWKIR